LLRSATVSALVLAFTAAIPVSAQAASKPTCFGQTATIVGTKGADRITLTPEHDVVVTLGGDDTIVPEFYNPEDGSASDPYIYSGPSPSRDFVCTGDGNDWIIGDQGSSGYAYKVDAGAGDDRIGSGVRIYAGPGNDEVRYLDCSPTDVHGGSGNDFIVTGRSAYAEAGEPGPRGDGCPDDDDKVWGDGGNDRIDGADGDDLIFGGPGKDEIHGGTGNNKLYGWAGSDTLVGDTGNDLLDGGGEKGDIDRCGGGLGKNTYVKCEKRIPGDHES
jgi:Ca2+-binding RTX toxin-like protein